MRGFHPTRNPAEKGLGWGTSLSHVAARALAIHLLFLMARSDQCTSPALCCPLRFELVKGLLPEEYHKVLANVRKAEARARRHRSLNQAADEEEEEEVEEPAQGKGDR